MAAENRHFSYVDRDDVTSERYLRAREELRTFLKLDASTVTTIDELDRVTPTVALAIRGVVLSAGTQKVDISDYNDEESGEPLFKKVFEIRKPVENHSILVSADEGVTIIENSNEKDGSSYRLAIPYASHPVIKTAEAIEFPKKGRLAERRAARYSPLKELREDEVDPRTPARIV